MRIFRKNVGGLSLVGRASLLILAAVMAVSYLVGCASTQYNQALELFEGGDMDGAREAFAKLEDYEDSAKYVRKIDAYKTATTHLSAGRYEEAGAAFDALSNFLDSAEQAKEAYYQLASSILGEERIWFLDVEAQKNIDQEERERLVDAANRGTHHEQREQASVTLTKAADILDSLEAYKDSAELASGIRTLMMIPEYKDRLWHLRIDGAAEFFAEFRERFAKLASSPEAAERAKECAAYEAYFTGRDLYLAGKYEQAVEQFKGVEVLDADMLHDFISAVVMLGNGNTVEALELALGCMDRAGFFDAGHGANQYIEIVTGEQRLVLSDYTAGMDIYAGFFGKAPLDASVPGFDFAQELVSYWEEQVDAGRNPASIEKIPYASDWMKRTFWGLYAKRVERMENAVTSQNLQSFYTSTDSKPSPINVTGFGIYVSWTKNERSGVDYPFTTLISHIGDPFFYADKPENARYLLLFTVSHRFHARWVYVSGGGFAGNTYHTTVTATLKDCATGEILHSISQTTRVPDNFVIYDDHYYAPAQFDMDEIVDLIKDLYNEW